MIKRDREVDTQVIVPSSSLCMVLIITEILTVIHEYCTIINPQTKSSILSIATSFIYAHRQVKNTRHHIISKLSLYSSFILPTDYYMHDSCIIFNLTASLPLSPNTLHIYTQNLGHKSLFFLSQKYPITMHGMASFS
jgi:hypothetical protein